MPRSIGRYQSQGTRNLSPEERGFLESDLAKATKEIQTAKLILVISIVVVAFGIALVSAFGPNAAAVLAFGLVGLVFGSLTWADRNRTFKALAKDLQVGTVEDFKADDDKTMVLSSGTGRLLLDNSHFVAFPTYLTVVETGVAVTNPTQPMRMDSIGEKQVGRRALSESEVSELKRLAKIPWGRVVFNHLILVYMVVSTVDHFIHERQQYYWILPLCFSVWLIFRNLTTWRSLRVLTNFAKDARDGFTYSVFQNGRDVEFLPNSKLVWRIAGETSPWRKNIQAPPSEVPPPN